MKLVPVVGNKENLIVEVNDEKIQPGNFLMYEGVLVDEPFDSKISGTIIDGSFVGSIWSKRSGEYFVEPGVRFDQSLTSKSIFYHESDVEVESEQALLKKKKSSELENNRLSCGSKNEYVENLPEKKKQLNNERKRRQTVVTPFNNDRDTCFMYLKVDPILYSVIFANEGNKVI